MLTKKIRIRFSIHPDAYDALRGMEERSCMSPGDIVSIALLQQEVRETIDLLPQVGQDRVNAKSYCPTLGSKS